MRGSYKQFCPVAMASEIVCTRWTMLLLRELCAGSTHFNELRRGVPRMSSALLAKRLRELEAAGILDRSADGAATSYHLTASGRELSHVVEALGVWGQRWVETEPSLDNADPQLLMWDMRRTLVADPCPQKRNVVQFEYPELAAVESEWWLVIEPDGAIDLCSVNPGFEIDLSVVSSLRAMTSIWLGQKSFGSALEAGDVVVTGDRELGANIARWICGSPFSVHPKMVVTHQMEQMPKGLSRH